MILYIFRGVPGSGKTTAANSIVGEDWVCSADDYFYEIGDGEYAFDASKLGKAHQYCQDKLKKLMEAGYPFLAVANTSTRERDVKEYIKIAKEHGYMPIVLTVENWHNGKSDHDVPEKSLERMKNQLLNSIKLR